MITAFFKLLCDTARLPEMAHEGDAAFDLFSAEEAIIPAKGSASVDIGIAWEPKFDGTTYKTAEERFYFQMFINFFKIQGKVESRSGLSFNRDIETGAGVIDGTYRGRFKVKLYNFGKEPYIVSIGDKVAQLKVEVLPKARSKLTATISEDTVRGVNGFGSTGK